MRVLGGKSHLSPECSSDSRALHVLASLSLVHVILLRICGLPAAAATIRSFFFVLGGNCRRCQVQSLSRLCNSRKL